MSSEMETAPLFADLVNPDLLGNEEERSILGLKAGRNVTGSRLSQDKRQAIIGLAGLGMGVKKIAAAVGVSDHTVTLTVRQAQKDVATVKERLAGDYLRDADEIRRSYMEDIRAGLVKPDTKWVSSATFADKSQVLAGEASVIVEHRHTGPAIEDLAKSLADLPEATVIECESESHDLEDSQAAGETALADTTN